MLPPEEPLDGRYEDRRPPPRDEQPHEQLLHQAKPSYLPPVPLHPTSRPVCQTSIQFERARNVRLHLESTVRFYQEAEAINQRRQWRESAEADPPWMPPPPPPLAPTFAPHPMALAPPLAAVQPLFASDDESLLAQQIEFYFSVGPAV